MSKLIDNVFDYDIVRYVPVIIQNEWKNLYNLYKGDFFNRQKKIYNIYCSNQNDYKNHEINKLNYMSKLINKFKFKILNLQPKYNTDIDYSRKVKKKLLISIAKISKFLKYKKIIYKNKLKYLKAKKNNKFIEKFTKDTNKSLSFNNKNIYLLLIFIILCYLLIN